jgi:acyl carrier protein
MEENFMNNIEEKIREIIKEFLEDTDVDVNSIGIEEELINYGVSSIVFIKMVLKIETEFLIEFEDEDLDNFRFPNIKRYVLFIEEKIKEAKV